VVYLWSTYAVLELDISHYVRVWRLLTLPGHVCSEGLRVCSVGVRGAGCGARGELWAEVGDEDEDEDAECLT